MVSKLSLKQIRRILKEYYKGEISGEACVNIRNLLVKLTHRIAQEGVKEFEEHNNCRMVQGLPKLKRLNPYILSKTTTKLFEFIDNLDVCREGHHNRETSLRKTQQG